MPHGCKFEGCGQDPDRGQRNETAPDEHDDARADPLAHVCHGVSAETILSTVSGPGLYLARLSRSLLRFGSSAG
jgi:hypothetical protein